MKFPTQSTKEGYTTMSRILNKIKDEHGKNYAIKVAQCTAEEYMLVKRTYFEDGVLDCALEWLPNEE